MDEKLLYWSSMAFGALSLALLVTNVAYINGDRRIQEEINQRQVMINRATSLNQLNQGLVQALAEAAANKGDTDIRGLLASQGITLKEDKAKGAESKSKPAENASDEPKKKK